MASGKTGVKGTRPGLFGLKNEKKYVCRTFSIGVFLAILHSIPVEHLGLKLGKLVLQVREFFGQSFDNAWVNSAHKAIIWGTQVL